MESTRDTLQEERAEIMKQLDELGEFRRGTVSRNYRKCGKPTCHCTKEGERGHGPQHLWNATIGGKSYARHLKTAGQVKQYEEETLRYRKFMALCKRFIEINERLCEMHCEPEEEAVEQAKKKLQMRSGKSSRRK
jgi:hypothetical protein